jgi:translocator protein
MLRATLWTCVLLCTAASSTLAFAFPPLVHSPTTVKLVKSSTRPAVGIAHQPTRTKSRIVLCSESSSSGSQNNKVAPQKNRKFDSKAVFKYALAIATQMGLFVGLTVGLDKLVDMYQLQIPLPANALLFYFFSLRSRIFNPLANTRPRVENLEIESAPKRKQPSWTPPGVVFPIMWLLLIGPLRAYTAALIVSATGSYAHPAILAFFLHLSIGDVWNTINNVERRYGVAVLGVVCVWLSKAYAAYQYMQVDTRAGQLLSLSLIWLTIAAALVTRIWQLNPDPDTGKLEPLYPVTGKTRTRFVWFQKKLSEAQIY